MDTATADVIPAVIPPVTPVLSSEEFAKEVYRLRQEGLGYQVIAKRLNSYPMKIKRVCDSFVTKTAEMLNVSLRPVNAVTVQDRLKQLAPECVESVNDLRSDKSSDIKLRASQDILNRAGFMPVQKNLNVLIIDDMTPSQRKEALINLLASKGIVIPIAPDANTQHTINILPITNDVSTDVATSNNNQ